jgi:hypothetical protein
VGRRVAPSACVLIALALFASPANAAFGIDEFDVTYSGQDGAPQSQAGSHDFDLATRFSFATKPAPGGGIVPDDTVKDLVTSLPAGLIADPSAVPYCSTADFMRIDVVHPNSACPNASGIGVLRVRPLAPGGKEELGPAFNLIPPPGVLAKIGFIFFRVPVVMEIRVNQDPPYNLIASLRNTSTAESIGGAGVTLWGVPASSRHDRERSACLDTEETCPLEIAERPFLTLPRSCTGPLASSYEASSWQEPNVFLSGEAESHDDAVPPNPHGLSGCGRLAFAPKIAAKPTTLAAGSPTGLDFSLDVQDEGLLSPDGLAAADIEKAIVTLPEGFSVNPSVAEGLEVCSEAELSRETAFSDPGDGCPNAAKIGTVSADSPVLREELRGGLYLATPYENPSGSLIALYVVLRNPLTGVIVKQPLEVRADPVTGQLTTIADQMPQLPFSSFSLHFREGTRSPLASPPACGTYEVGAELYPSSGTPPITTSSAFQIISGPAGGPCPPGGLPPFKPGLIAGSLNNAAGRFSPFNVRMFRSDPEQEITRFSIKLPPGIVAKLAGVPYCSERAIAAAKARTGPRGGAEELRRPSCSAQSLIGKSLAGFGVGPSLTYAPGRLYLAGPYNGAPLSVVAITSGTVGPFDLGTVVIREAFQVDPETGEVFIDSTGSDPIPHIIKGIPVHLRDIRAYADRAQFVLNPTSCKRTSTASTLLGAGLNFGSATDDRPLTVSTPFQAADCAALSFKPRLSLKLKGGTKRGDHPAFTATLRMNGIGEAGVKSAQVTLPSSEFIENAHFKTICTRAQFKAGDVPGEKCPTGSIYGQAKVSTPILAEPLQGPIFLRSSEHKLPDMVTALDANQIDVVLSAHIDSVRGRLRASFESIPDAPLSSATFQLKGGAKGLFVNSTNLCKATHRARVSFAAQNGKSKHWSPALEASCAKKRKAG